MNYVLISWRTLFDWSIRMLFGEIVESIALRNFKGLKQTLIQLAIFALPGGMLETGMKYCEKKIALIYRTNLSDYFNQRYLEDLKFYQVSRIDTRIKAIDARLTQDISRWADAAASIHNKIGWPISGLVAFCAILRDNIGWKAPATVVGWYVLSNFIVNFVSPPFDVYEEEESSFMKDYSHTHSDLVQYSPEIVHNQLVPWLQ